MLWPRVRAQPRAVLDHNPSNILYYFALKLAFIKGIHTHFWTTALSLPVLAFCKSTHTQKKGQVVFQGQYTLKSVSYTRIS